MGNGDPPPYVGSYVEGDTSTITITNKPLK
jgi:hypothetical protein